MMNDGSMRRQADRQPMASLLSGGSSTVYLTEDGDEVFTSSDGATRITVPRACVRWQYEEDMPAHPMATLLMHQGYNCRVLEDGDEEFEFSACTITVPRRFRGGDDFVWQDRTFKERYDADRRCGGAMDDDASSFVDAADSTRMSAAAKLAVLSGTMIEANPLSLLRANPLVWSRVFDAVEREYAWQAAHVDRVPVACKTIDVPWWCAAEDRARFEFPPPSGLSVNMMPFKLFQARDTLPPELQAYEPIIFSCAQLNNHLFRSNPSARDHVAYLTVHESAVPVGSTQRRAGVHIERPGGMVDGGRIVHRPPREVFGTPDYDNSEYHYLAWGLGAWVDGFPVEGLFMASNVADSCAVWPVLIDRPEEVTDAHGGVPDAMLPHLGRGHRRTLAAGELMWLTDRTPHESLPVKAPADDPGATTVYRQFFRLVVGRISVWYARHNTPNPLGVEPEAPVSHEDKFHSSNSSKRVQRYAAVVPLLRSGTAVAPV